jgi:hypothetical protein
VRTDKTVETKQDKEHELHTHEEIMKVFKDLEIIEAKVKNPTIYGKELLKSTTNLTDFERHVHRTVDVLQTPRLHKPRGEVTQKQEGPSTLLPERKEKLGTEPKKTHRFPFINQERNVQRETIAQIEVEKQISNPPVTRSTFVLQLDENGTLIGLPIKKPKPDHKKSRFSLRKTPQEVSDESTEQPPEGIRGRLQQIGSLFHRKSSAESESGSGVGDKLKGLFRRT